MELFQRDELRSVFPGTSASRTYTFSPMYLFGQIGVSVFKTIASEGLNVGAQALFRKVVGLQTRHNVVNFKLENVTEVDAFVSTLGQGDPEIVAGVAFFVLPERRIYLEKKGSLADYIKP